MSDLSLDEARGPHCTMRMRHRAAGTICDRLDDVVEVTEWLLMLGLAAWNDSGQLVPADDSPEGVWSPRGPIPQLSDLPLR
jgi:hypothetical protein